MFVCLCACVCARGPSPQSAAELKLLLAECQRKNRDLADRLAAKEAEADALRGVGTDGSGGEVKARLVEMQAPTHAHTVNE